MTHSILNRTLLLLLITATLIAFSIEVPEDESIAEEHRIPKAVERQLEYRRLKRQHHIVKRATRKPGFFRTLFSVVFEQWNDTRHTVGRINKLVNDNFLPDNAKPVEATTSSDPNASTTPAPYKITRSEFNRIVMRNLRGLIRLYNIELQDALKQSDKNWPSYKKNASLEVSKFL